MQLYSSDNKELRFALDYFPDNCVLAIVCESFCFPAVDLLYVGDISSNN